MSGRIASIIFMLSLLIASCQPNVTRISPDTQVDLSGRWNDTDSHIVADKMIHDLLASTRFSDYAKQKGRKPVIVIGLIKNKTSEHIDANAYIKKLEVSIYNSNIADVVESEEFRDHLRQERAQQQDFADPATVSRWGKEIGADLMLFGEMTSETDTNNRSRVVNYNTTLFLTDIETNQRIWYGEQEIKKMVKN